MPQADTAIPGTNLKPCPDCWDMIRNFRQKFKAQVQKQL